MGSLWRVGDFPDHFNLLFGYDRISGGKSWKTVWDKRVRGRINFNSHFDLFKYKTIVITVGWASMKPILRIVNPRTHSRSVKLREIWNSTNALQWDASNS